MQESLSRIHQTTIKCARRLTYHRSMALNPAIHNQFSPAAQLRSYSHTNGQLVTRFLPGALPQTPEAKVWRSMLEHFKHIRPIVFKFRLEIINAVSILLSIKPLFTIQHQRLRNNPSRTIRSFQRSEPRALPTPSEHTIPKRARGTQYSHPQRLRQRTRQSGDRPHRSDDPINIPYPRLTSPHWNIWSCRRRGWPPTNPCGDASYVNRFMEGTMMPFESWEAAREHGHTGVAVKSRVSAVRRKMWEEKRDRKGEVGRYLVGFGGVFESQEQDDKDDVRFAVVDFLNWHIPGRDNSCTVNGDKNTRISETPSHSNPSPTRPEERSPPSTSILGLVQARPENCQAQNQSY